MQIGVGQLELHRSAVWLLQWMELVGAQVCVQQVCVECMQVVKLLREQQVQWQALLAVSALEHLQAALAWLGPRCRVKSLLLGRRQGVALG